MNRRLVLLPGVALLALAAWAPAHAQAPAKPLTQSELMQTIDSLGAGDPVSRSPLGSGDERRAATAAKAAKPKPASQQGKPGQTEITSDEASFDNRSHQAIFIKNVYVKNPDFTLSCEKLTATLKAQKTKVGAEDAEAIKAKPPRLSAGNGTATVDATETPRPPSADKAGGLEKAVAEGSVVITRERLDTDGNLLRDVGRGKKAVYEAATGNVILSGKPEVDQGINTCVSLDEGTIIILNRNGEMKTIGPTKMVIRDNTSTERATNGR